MKAPTSSKAKITSASLEDSLAKIDPKVIDITDTSDLSQSPLLNAPIIEKDYTNRTITSPIEQTPILGAPVTQESVNNLNKPQSSEFEMEEELPLAYKPSAEFNHIKDVPEQEIKMPGGPQAVDPNAPNPSTENNSSGPLVEGSDNIDKMMEEGSESLANTALGVWKQLVPTLAHNVTKMKTRAIKEDVRSGLIDESILTDIEGRNKENLELFKTQAKQDVAMMEKPLKKLLIKKGIQAPPHVELIMVLVVVVIMNGFLFFQIKKENESFMNRLSSKIRQKKEDRDMPATPAETVSKS